MFPRFVTSKQALANQEMVRMVGKQFIQEYAPRLEVSGKTSKDDDDSSSSSKNGGGACLLVVSSTSGRGNAARLVPRVTERLRSSFSKVVVVPSMHKGHVYEIMNSEPNLSETYDLAVVLSGDGGFSEAVNGMLSRDDQQTVTLAHCPGGSGCATSGNTLGVWKGDDIDKALDIVLKGKVGSMDVMELKCPDGQVRYSISAISGGIYTDVVDLADRYYRWTYRPFGPTARYAFGLIHAFLKFGHGDNGRILRYTTTYSDGQVESQTLPTCGFAIYNSGRVVEHAQYAQTRVDSGDVSIVIDKRYMGFSKQMKAVAMAAKGETMEGEYADNRVVRDKVTSFRIDPIISDDTMDDDDQRLKVNSSKTKNNETQTSSSHRPATFMMDGEYGRGCSRCMQAPLSGKVLPGKLKIIVA